MKTYTIDNIVRQTLTDRGYTMHWYLQFLNYAINALRELNFDTLQNVKSVRMPVDSIGALKLPCDYVDFIRIGNELGEFIDPYVQREAFNNMYRFDENGNKTKYDNIDAASGYFPANYDGLFYSNYANDKGELTGRIFNGQPSLRHSFKVIKERNEIQLDITFAKSTIALDYITDGTSVDASNAVHPYAINTIKAYIVWQMKEHNRYYNLSERETSKNIYYNELRILRGRLNSMDDVDIRRSLAVAYGPTIKMA
jgi:hypothetical protein